MVQESRAAVSECRACCTPVVNEITQVWPAVGKPVL